VTNPKSEIRNPQSNGFYKASKALLRRTDLTDAQKIIEIVRRHWLAFEGREPTTAELVAATGKSDRTIRRAKADKLSAPNRTKCPAKMSAQADKLSAPNVVKTSVRDVDKGGRQAAPPPLDVFAEKAGERGGMLAMLALKARAGGGKWPLAQWIGQVEEDEAAGRYRRADLEAFVAGRTAVTESPWRLAEGVRRHAEVAKAAAFRERLRVIRAEGLTQAEGPDGPGRVVYVDPDMPLLVIEQPLPAVPGTSYGPGKKRWEVTTPADLAAWRFRADQPRLFDFGVGIPESGFKGKGERR